MPRWKSEFRLEMAVEESLEKRRELTKLFMTVVCFPVLQSSFVEWGVEYERFRKIRDVRPQGARIPSPDALRRYSCVTPPSFRATT